MGRPEILLKKRYSHENYIGPVIRNFVDTYHLVDGKWVRLDLELTDKERVMYRVFGRLYRRAEDKL